MRVLGYRPYLNKRHRSLGLPRLLCCQIDKQDLDESSTNQNTTTRTGLFPYEATVDYAVQNDHVLLNGEDEVHVLHGRRWSTVQS